MKLNKSILTVAIVLNTVLPQVWADSTDPSCGELLALNSLLSSNASPARKVERALVILDRQRLISVRSPVWRPSRGITQAFIRWSERSFLDPTDPAQFRITHKHLAGYFGFVAEYGAISDAVALTSFANEPILTPNGKPQLMLSKRVRNLNKIEVPAYLLHAWDYLQLARDAIFRIMTRQTQDDTAAAFRLYPKLESEFKLFSP